MPGKAIYSLGNLIIDTAVYLPAAAYPTIAASGIGTTTITIPGVQPLDIISWNVQGLPAHLALENVYVSALNTAVFTWSTDTSGISAGTVPVMLEITRADGANLGTSILPTTLA
jgi:hypothetical protein